EKESEILGGLSEFRPSAGSSDATVSRPEGSTDEERRKRAWVPIYHDVLKHAGLYHVPFELLRPIRIDRMPLRRAGTQSSRKRREPGKQSRSVASLARCSDVSSESNLIARGSPRSCDHESRHT